MRLILNDHLAIKKNYFKKNYKLLLDATESVKYFRSRKKIYKIYIYYNKNKKLLQRSY